MANENTAHLGLPLPHPDNLLEGDVHRLREALERLDSKASAQAMTQALAGKADVQALQNVTTRVEQVAAGIPKLNNTTISTSTTEAATANAAKQAYDRGTAGVNAANAAQGTANAANTAAAGAQGTANTALAAANEAKAAAQAAQGAIANVNPYKIGEFKSWFEQTPPAGWAVRNGQILYTADRDYPDLWNYLQQPANTWKCLKLAQWNAKSSAAGGVGGVPFFVVDVAAKTIKLPDTRGDYERDAGSGYLQAVGGWHDSAIKNISGYFNFAEQAHIGLCAYSSPATGPFYLYGNYSSAASPPELAFPARAVGFDAARAVAVASENRTRTYGTLGCVYIRRT